MLRSIAYSTIFQPTSRIHIPVTIVLCFPAHRTSLNPLTERRRQPCPYICDLDSRLPLCWAHSALSDKTIGLYLKRSIWPGNEDIYCNQSRSPSLQPREHGMTFATRNPFDRHRFLDTLRRRIIVSTSQCVIHKYINTSA